MLFNTPDLIQHSIAAVPAPFESYQSLETADGRFGDLSIFALDQLPMKDLANLASDLPVTPIKIILANH